MKRLKKKYIYYIWCVDFNKLAKLLRSCNMWSWLQLWMLSIFGNYGRQKDNETYCILLYEYCTATTPLCCYTKRKKWHILQVSRCNQLCESQWIYYESQIYGVIGGRFDQQVDFSRSKQRHVWAEMCRTERGSGLYLAPAAARVSAENLSLLNKREHHSREVRPNPSTQARRERERKGWEEERGNVCLREDYYIRRSLSSVNTNLSAALSLTAFCSQISTHLFYTLLYTYHGPFCKIYFTILTFLNSSSVSLVFIYCGL